MVEEIVKNADWGMITDVILGAAILWIVVLAFLGLCQWIKRKNLFKVDKWIFWMGIIMITMGAIYLFFNQVLVLNYSPLDSTKPSFPSSHVLVSWTVFLTTMIAAPRFMKNKALRVIAIILMLVLMAIVAYGRVWSGDHWISDIWGGAGMAVVLSFIYWLIIREKKHGKRIHEDN